MVNFLRTYYISRILIFSVLVSFTLSIIPHPILASEINMGPINDAAFVIRVEKLYEKIKKYGQKLDKKNLIEKTIDLKNEIEAYTGQKLSIHKMLDQVEEHIKSKGAKLKKGEMEAIRKMLKNQEKRSHHKSLYMQTCLECGLLYNAEEEELLYCAKHEKKDGVEVEVPLRVTIGVTMALCGLFLCVIPLPVAKPWGMFLLQTGAGLAIDGTITRAEENKKK